MKPQLPITAVVTPCQHELLPDASQNTWASMWVCPSMNPGVTTWPSASISAAAALLDPAHEGDATTDDADVGPERAEA